MKFLLLSLSLACCATSAASAADIVPASAADRAAMLARGRVWVRTDIPSKDIMRGPNDVRTFPFASTVRCTFDEPDPRDPPGGATPKFYCTDSTDDSLKIKYGTDNGEVPSEIAASRLMWALGFPSDRYFPVRVECHNCPREPWTYIERVIHGQVRDPDEINVHERWNFERGDFVFNPALVEKKFPGEEIEQFNDQGWRFRELLDFRQVPLQEQIHREGLVLLLSMLQHADSKAAQQRMVCTKDEIVTRSDGTKTCRSPLLFVHDLGWAFGAGASFTRDPFSSSMELNDWRVTPVWKDVTTCRAGVNDSLNGSFVTINVREASRAFLASLLSQLSRRQIEDIFRVARVELRWPVPATLAAGQRRILAFADLFEAKRKEIVEARCPR